MSKKKKKPYFPNNWKELKNVPAEFFDDLSFEEFMDWKIAGWELPSSVSCIIREKNLSSGKITEHVYQREHAARRKAQSIMNKGESEFYVCSRDAIHYMYPKLVEEYDDPLS